MEWIEKTKDYVVCIKPVGPDSEQELPRLLSQQLGGDFFPVHRLDQNVGGLMVYARTRAAAAQLSRIVQQGQLEKTYLALVHGTPPDAGDWTDLLWKDRKKNKVYPVKRLRAGVKEARLTFIRLRAGAESLVEVHLITGRSHQIRVQFASRGYPLVGDHKYGARDAAAAPMLFSAGLAFPWQGQVLHFTRQPEWAKEAGSSAPADGESIPSSG